MILFNEETLSVEEVEAKVRFRKGATVILSACNGARQKLEKRGPTSFARAFFALGASCVVGTLWNVGDWTTFELMKLMYVFLMAGLSVAHAQRVAILQTYQQHQKYCLQQHQSHRGHGCKNMMPRSFFLDGFHHWAGFVVIGAKTRAIPIPAGLSWSLCSRLKGKLKNLLLNVF